MVVRWSDDNMTESYKTETVDDIPVFVIEDNYMSIDLISDKIDRSICKTIPLDDNRKLYTIISWLNTKEMIEWIYSPKYNKEDLYLYVRTKVASDKDIRDWWRYYNFKMNIHFYYKE